MTRKPPDDGLLHTFSDSSRPDCQTATSTVPASSLRQGPLKEACAQVGLAPFMIFLCISFARFFILWSSRRADQTSPKTRCVMSTFPLDLPPSVGLRIPLCSSCKDRFVISSKSCVRGINFMERLLSVRACKGVTFEKEQETMGDGKSR